MEKLNKVDFHCHSTYSPDSLNQLPMLIRTAKTRGLDRLVITDPNSLQGALIAREMAPDFIIMGEEIMTDRGELLAAFVKQEIPRDLPTKKVIAMLREQDAFISVSHPFDPLRGWALRDLMEIKDLVDAVEVYNARCLREDYNIKALDFAQKYGLGWTVGSDAHTPFEIGRVSLHMPEFNDAEGLKSASRNGEVLGRLSPAWVHVLSGIKHKIYRINHPK